MSAPRILIVVAAACAAGCSPHYAVTDTATQTIYLTREYKQTGESVTFKDRVTKRRLTVDNPEITTIGEHEYDALRKHLQTQARATGEGE
ncbi:MAG: hypothetical protein AAF937_08065 [Planctomycetota bacterium]